MMMMIIISVSYQHYSGQNALPLFWGICCMLDVALRRWINNYSAIPYFVKSGQA